MVVSWFSARAVCPGIFSLVRYRLYSLFVMRESIFNGYSVRLVESISDLDLVKQELYPSIRVGIDTETTGLSYLRHSVVGVCIATGKSYSTADYRGYYLPIRHSVGTNLPVDVVIQFVQFIIDNYWTVFWNRNFDLCMLEKDGLRVPFVGKMHDSQVMAHECFNEKFPGLKDFAKKLLHWQMIDFSENAADGGNFGMTDPALTFVYAAGDPLATSLLANVIWSRYPHIHKIYKLDNYALEAVRLMGKCELFVDYDFLEKEQIRTQLRMSAIQREMFSLVGYAFNIRSSKDKADALQRFVTLTEKTDKGGWKLDEEALLKLDHPLATLMAEHSHLATYLSTFVSKMVQWKDKIPHVYANYSIVNVASGRLSSGASKGNDYFAPINIQNLPKEEVKMYLHPHPFLGYCLSPEEDGCYEIDGVPVKVKTKSGFRRALTVPEGTYWVTADYASQEIALTANFSKEPNFLIPLKNGLDVHLYTAKSMFGFEDPNHRTSVKILNFSCLYGATAFTVAKKLKVAYEKGLELMERYKSTMKKLYAWKRRIVEAAKKSGFSTTYFGRHIYVGKYFNDPSPGRRAYGERLAVNSTIQGPLSGDTRCITSGGYIPLHDLFKMQQDGTLMLECWTGFSWEPFSVVSAGESEVIEVSFEDGSRVLCDSRHKFLTVTDHGLVYSSVLDLACGDCVASSEPKMYACPDFFDAPSFVTDDFCWLSGFVFGSLRAGSEGLPIHMSRARLLYLDRFLSCVESLKEFFKDLDVKSKVHSVRSGNVADDFILSSKELERAFLELGVYSDEPLTKLPEFLFKSALSFRIAFVRGYNAANGRSVLSKNLGWRLSTIELARDFHDLFYALGVRGRIVSYVGSYDLILPTLRSTFDVLGLSGGNSIDCLKLDTRFVHSYFSSQLMGFRARGSQSWLVKFLRTVRRGAKCSLSQFKQASSEVGLAVDNLVLHKVVESVRRLPFTSDFYCLSVSSGDNHCYDAGQVISHNCTPSFTYVYSADGRELQSYRSGVGVRIPYPNLFLGSHDIGVPTFRGEADIWGVLFKSGDFCLCSPNHKFGKYGDPAVLLDLDQICRTSVQLVSPHKKRFVNLFKLVGAKATSVTTLSALLSVSRAVKADDLSIYLGLLRSCILREKLLLSWTTAFALRCVADTFGFNLVACRPLAVTSFKGPWTFRLKWGRQASSKCLFRSNTGIIDNVVSPSMLTGLQLYSLAGFIHKNTGGDLIRIALVKFMKLAQNDPEWRANVGFLVTVHDEVNFWVKAPYLHKATAKIQEIMNFKPDNFEVPIRVELGVGTCWGDCLDCERVDENNKLVLDGIDVSKLKIHHASV